MRYCWREINIEGSRFDSMFSAQWSTGRPDTASVVAAIVRADKAKW